MATKKRSSIINSAVFPDERRKRSLFSSIEFALRIIQLEKGDRSAGTDRFTRSEARWARRKVGER